MYDSLLSNLKISKILICEPSIDFNIREFLRRFYRLNFPFSQIYVLSNNKKIKKLFSYYLLPCFVNFLNNEGLFNFLITKKDYFYIYLQSISLLLDFIKIQQFLKIFEKTYFLETNSLQNELYIYDFLSIKNFINIYQQNSGSYISSVWQKKQN